MLLWSLVVEIGDTTLPKGYENFWYYSSCCAVASVETLGFYASTGLGGFFPVLVGAGAGGLGCLAYSNIAKRMTPVPELKPKAAKKAVDGGILGAFVGGVVVVLASYLAK
ncbi:MAG: hypothetical protein GXO39_01915 [Thermotogae bacterium]|nr:hypothetical protein [Thermotogota bacterium]